jgi:hypothetical protein
MVINAIPIGNSEVEGILEEENVIGIVIAAGVKFGFEIPFHGKADDTIAPERAVRGVAVFAYNISIGDSQ